METGAGQTDTVAPVGVIGADTAAVVGEDTTTTTITKDVVEGQVQVVAITEDTEKPNLPDDTPMRPRPRLEARL